MMWNVGKEEFERLRVVMQQLRPEDITDSEKVLAMQLGVVMTYQVKCFKLVTYAFRLTALNFALVAILYFWMWPSG